MTKWITAFILKNACGTLKCWHSELAIPILFWSYYYETCRYIIAIVILIAIVKPRSYFLPMPMRYEFWRHRTVFAATVLQDLNTMSTDANFYVENLWHQNSLSIPRKYEPGFPCMGVQYTYQWQNKMCVPTAYVYMWYDSKLCMVIFYGLFNDANTLGINKLL